MCEKHDVKDLRATMKESTTHVAHHYVPEFLLGAWHSGADNKLAQYSWVPKGLDIQRYTAKAVAKQVHLYSSTSASGERDNRVEKDYFGPEIDNKAAPVVRRLIDMGVDGLSSDQREVWARFLVAQMVRVPSMLQYFATFAEREFTEGAKAIASQPGRASFLEYARNNEPHAGANAAVGMLETVIEDEKLNSALLNAKWRIFQPKNSKFDLLVGDNPLIMLGGMSDNFIAALPLGPRTLFCAASDEGTLGNIESESHTDVVSTVNKDSITKAAKYVYAKDTSQTALVKKYLKKRF